MKERKIDDDVLIEMLRQGKMQKEAAAFFGCTEPAITKRLKKLLPPPKLDRLTEKERKFCLKVAEGKTQTQAALESFDCSTRDSAKSIGATLMAKDEINASIRELMDYVGMGRGYRVRKLKGLVDHVNPDISLRALDQTWKLDKSYSDAPTIEINLKQLILEGDSINMAIERLEQELSGYLQTG